MTKNVSSIKMAGPLSLLKVTSTKNMEFVAREVSQILGIFLFLL
jgi:hypothetical protein